MKKLFTTIIVFLILFLYLYSICFYYISNSSSNFSNASEGLNSYFFSSVDFFWPIPGYHNITSRFGKRISPTTGASSNHSGIDISAPEGTSIHSVLPGNVTFTGFSGANGHTIIINSNNYSALYAHVSPNYIVQINDFINKGDIISFVGPKYINDVINNPYKDSTGKSTNGATTGPHLHLTIKKDNVPINPILLFE